MLASITTPAQVAVVLFHDARAVHDVALIRPDRYLTQGGFAWVVAEVRPGARSGSSTVPGAYVDGETGQMVSPDDAKSVTVKEGTWKSVASSSPTEVGKEGEYSWTEPPQRKRQAEPEDYYSPFVSGGTILFRLVSGAKGIGQFGFVCLLVQDWSQYVAPAFDLIQNHPRLFVEGAAAPDDAAKLTPLLSAGNELLAVLAFRQLLRTEQAHISLVREQMDRSESHLAAILTYLILSAPADGDKDSERVQEIARLVDVSRDSAKLRSIGLGAFAASLFGSADAGVLAKSRRVLVPLRKRIAEIKPDAATDAYLGAIFEKMNIQK